MSSLVLGFFVVFPSLDVSDDENQNNDEDDDA